MERTRQSVRHDEIRSFRAAGFTLIEMMIVVVIIGVLAGIAYPSYREYVVRSNRSAAQTFLMEVSNRQKQYLLDARQYAETLSDLKIAETPTEVSKYYTVTISVVTSPPPPSFTISATPITNKAQDGDGTLTLTDTGAKGPSGKW